MIDTFTQQFNNALLVYLDNGIINHPLHLEGRLLQAVEADSKEVRPTYGEFRALEEKATTNLNDQKLHTALHHLALAGQYAAITAGMDEDTLSSNYLTKVCLTEDARPIIDRKGVQKMVTEANCFPQTTIKNVDAIILGHDAFIYGSTIGAKLDQADMAAWNDWVEADPNFEEIVTYHLIENPMSRLDVLQTMYGKEVDHWSFYSYKDFAKKHSLFGQNNQD